MLARLLCCDSLRHGGKALEGVADTHATLSSAAIRLSLVRSSRLSACAGGNARRRLRGDACGYAPGQAIQALVEASMAAMCHAAATRVRTAGVADRPRAAPKPLRPKQSLDACPCSDTRMQAG